MPKYLEYIFTIIVLAIAAYIIYLQYTRQQIGGETKLDPSQTEYNDDDAAGPYTGREIDAMKARNARYRQVTIPKKKPSPFNPHKKKTTDDSNVQPYNFNQTQWAPFNNGDDDEGSSNSWDKPKTSQDDDEGSSNNWDKPQDSQDDDSGAQITGSTTDLFDQADQYCAQNLSDDQGDQKATLYACVYEQMKKYRGKTQQANADTIPIEYE